MREEYEMNQNDRRLEQALGSLRPRGARLDTVAAAFAAGRESARRQNRVWQTVAALVALAAVGTWLIPPQSKNVHKPESNALNFVARERPILLAPPAAQSAAMLQNEVLDRGIDAMPAANVPTVQMIHEGNSI